MDYIWIAWVSPTCAVKRGVVPTLLMLLGAALSLCAEDFHGLAGAPLWNGAIQLTSEKAALLAAGIMARRAWTRRRETPRATGWSTAAI